MTGAKVVSRWFEERYARLIVSMSMGEAKETLGFPASYNPSPQEISKAWRQKAFENHPDRGGSHEKMVEINVAKDILEGKTRAQWRPEPPPPPPPKPEPPKVVDRVPGVSFAKAISEFPNVEWGVVSSKIFGRRTDYSKDIAPTSDWWAWVLIGKSGDKFVVASVMTREPSKFLSAEKGGFVEVERSWYIEYRISSSSPKLEVWLPKTIKSVLISSGAEFDVPKKWVLWKFGRPTEENLESVRYGAGVALKDALIGAGLATTSVSKRKTVVEIYGNRNPEKRRKITQLFQYKKIDMKDMLLAYDVFLRVNGKEYLLSDETVYGLIKNHFMSMIMNWDMPEFPKNLTRLRGGMLKGDSETAMRLLADAVKGNEPADLVNLLEKVASEYSKTARIAGRYLSNFSCL